MVGSLLLWNTTMKAIFLAECDTCCYFPGCQNPSSISKKIEKAESRVNNLDFFFSFISGWWKLKVDQISIAVNTNYLGPLFIWYLIFTLLVFIDATTHSPVVRDEGCSLFEQSKISFARLLKENKRHLLTIPFKAGVLKVCVFKTLYQYCYSRQQLKNHNIEK